MSTVAVPPTTSRNGEPSRPAPRKTYGRQRPLSPPPDEPATSHVVAEAETSPSKGLLIRWFAAGTSWRDSLSFLGSKSSETDNDARPSPEPAMHRARLTDFAKDLDQTSTSGDSEQDAEDDLDAIKREMENRRRALRGDPMDVDAPKSHDAPPLRVARLQITRPGLSVSFGSSSLTSIPSSPLRSSPSKLANPTMSVRPLHTSSSDAAVLEEETVSIRKSGLARASGRRPKVVESDTEDDGDKPVDEVSPPPHKTRQSVTPTPDDGSITDQSTSSVPSGMKRHIPGPRHGGRGLEGLKHKKGARDSDTMARSPLPFEQEGPPDSFALFFSTLGGDDDPPEPKSPRPLGEISHSDPGSEPVGLFDDEQASLGKPKKMRPLNKKDMKMMHSGLAEAQRNRAVEIAKPEADHLPISSWLAMAAPIISQKRKNDEVEVPGLTFGRETPSSPAQVTPDDIRSFTPSSGVPRDRTNTLAPLDSKISIDPDSSSPTAHRSRPIAGRAATVIPGTSDDHDEESLPDLGIILAEQTDNAKIKEERLARAKRLNEAKAQALKMKRPARIADSDDEFDVLPDAPTSRQVSVKTKAIVRRFPDAKAVLHQTNSAPAISKQGQAVLRRAGKLTKPKDNVTETFLNFAGQVYKHADMKRANAGAVPSGQKKGRDSTISQAQIDAMMRVKHQQQISALQRKKEADWGRVRNLPQRQQQDYAAMIAASARHAEIKEEEDDERDDDDFAPEGEDVEEYGGEDEGIAYSGEESGEEEAEEEGGTEDEIENEESSRSETGNPDTDKENQPQIAEEDDDEPMPVIRRKPHSSARVALDSDDETEKTPKAILLARQPLAEVAMPSPTIKSPQTGNSFDLAGFGSGRSPGFSQLFEPTQPADQLTAKDGFANLRDQAPFALLPANVLLPGANITETQAARDNALIAGEVEISVEPTLQSQRPKQRYLNEQGFFTQTKPSTLVPITQHSDDVSQSTNRRSLLAGRSNVSEPDVTLSSTQKDYIELTASEKGSGEGRLSTTSSPTQGTQTYTRLKRRSSPDPSDPMDLDSTPALPVRNVFDHIMLAAKRRDEKRKAIKSNLIDVQAEESDEDGGWAPQGGAEDEDDDADDEGYVPDLVDDQTIDEAEKNRQDELAAAKAREIEAADDARREAEAKKITEGQYRTKKRGIDFYSDDEDDGEGGGKRRWSKKERRKRKLEREDGLDKLDGEANVFRLAYEEDLASDVDSIDDDPLPERQRERSATVEESAARNYVETVNMLRERAKKNRRDLDNQDADLDLQIGFDGAGFQTRGAFDLDNDDLIIHAPDEEESQFSISRSIRTTASVTLENDQLASRRLAVQRSTDVYAQFVRDESQVTRRAGGAGGVSVVVNRTGSGGMGMGPRPSLGVGKSAATKGPSRQGSGSSSTGSVLLSKGNRFG